MFYFSAIVLYLMSAVVSKDFDLILNHDDSSFLKKGPKRKFFYNDDAFCAKKRCLSSHEKENDAIVIPYKPIIIQSVSSDTSPSKRRMKVSESRRKIFKEKDALTIHLDENKPEENREHFINMLQKYSDYLTLCITRKEQNQLNMSQSVDQSNFPSDVKDKLSKIKNLYAYGRLVGLDCLITPSVLENLEMIEISLSKTYPSLLPKEGQWSKFKFLKKVTLNAVRLQHQIIKQDRLPVFIQNLLKNLPSTIEFVDIHMADPFKLFLQPVDKEKKNFFTEEIKPFVEKHKLTSLKSVTIDDVKVF